MNPNTPSKDQPLRDQPGAYAPRQNSDQSDRNDRSAAAQIMRDQINRLYETQDPARQHAPTRAESTYHRTHSEAEDHARSQQHSWDQYHSQWQNYYQQYYERYYMAQLANRQTQLSGERHAANSSTPAMVTAGVPEQSTDTGKSGAVSELRSQLLERVREQTKRVRGSRHFIPITAALVVGLTFVFLQYNGLIFATARAFISPGSIEPANLVIDPTVDTKVGPEPRVVIPKINVDYYVSYDVPSIAESVVQQKLKQGVVHYPIPGASALPGQKGNAVFLGHSSNDVFDDGVAKFAFVQLNNLEKGDTFYLNYNGTRYTYSVTSKKIIKPTQVSELVIGNDKPVATLVTCDPPGTALNRLIVFADQISPDPDQATTSDQSSGDTSKASIAGNSPTLFQRLFGQ